VLEQLSAIGAMTMAMSRASTAEQVYREALDAIGRVTGSTRASVLLFDPDGVLRFKAWRGLSDQYRAAVEGHTPWRPGQELPEPILIPDVAVDRSLGHYQATILGEGIRAMSFIPLVTGGGTIGKFMVYYEAPHRFVPEEVQLVRNIAAHTAFAIDRQRAMDLLEAERGLFNGGPTVLFQWRPGPEWLVEYVSPNIAAQFGYRAEELAGGRTSYSALIHPDDRMRAVQEEYGFLAEGRVSYETEYRLRRADGEYRWVYDFSIPVRNAAGEVVQFHGYVLDVHERRAAAEALRAAEARLREAQRLESLGILAGGIAHDFNNLLMGVMGNVSLLLRDLPDDSPMHGTARDIETAARRAADLTRQLLAYSGKGKFVVERLDLSRLIAESGQLLTAVISKKATLHYHLGEALPPVEGDATQLRQVVMNLITNASDSLGDRPGTVTITTGLEALDGSWPDAVFHAGQPEPGRYLFLEVRDTGSGMDDGTLRRIFDPFFTTKFHGRGLGLAATLGIVRGHHGAIRVETAPGRGTAFRLYLPAVEGASLVPEHTPARGIELTSNGMSATVLVVDDEAVVRDVSRRVLERGGFHVRLAENGRRALEVLDQNGAGIAIVLLDLTMPELSGEETLIRLRQRWPHLPVILTSGYSADADTSQLLSRGAAGFIQKPYPAGELLRLVRATLEPEVRH
jgi:PAS domain S-box-containing protein